MPGFHLPNIGIKEKIPGREVLIDADCVAYWAAAGQDELPLRAATLRADQRMQQILAETQSEKYCGYLTGERNFRDAVATLQRYKGNRYDADGVRIKPQPLWLSEVRAYLIAYWGCILVDEKEADDALSTHAAQATWEVVISSIDKDLRINQGLHHDMNSGMLSKVEGFGELYMSGADLKGSGLKFFCAQMLMGDQADWVKGLPAVTPWMKDMYGIARLGGCGAKAAYQVINDMPTYDIALFAVWQCYKDYWKDHEYIHWKTGEVFKAGIDTAYKQFLEQGRLLWMQQAHNEIWTPPVHILKDYIKDKDESS